MGRVPKDILERLSYFHQEVDGLFRRLFEDEVSSGALGDESSFPPVDVVETPDAILVRVDLPGLEKDEILLYGAPNFLVIRGTKPAPTEKWAYLRLERSFGQFQRLVVLPVPGNTSKISAKFEHGVLEVRIPTVQDRRRIHCRIPIE